VLVKKAPPAVATVTDADGTHILGVPARSLLRAESLNVDGVLVKLRGGLRGWDGIAKLALQSRRCSYPVAGMFLVHGQMRRFTGRFFRRQSERGHSAFTSQIAFQSRKIGAAPPTSFPGNPS